MKIKVLGKRARIGAPPYEHRPGYVFTDDPACADYDWLVVYDEMPGEDVGTFRGGCEPLACPRERTILATWEPTSVKRYSRAYTRQFGHLLTNRPPEAERHPHYHLGRGYYYWFIGRTYPEARDVTLPPKTKDISCVCSAKRMRHTRHYDRFRLVSHLAQSIPGLDWFGHGVRSFGAKFEVMDPYRYHVVVENHVGPHHWTEKLADAWLSECLPFYAGDPALGEVFPDGAFVPIPIDDPARAADIIRRAMAEDAYGRRRAAILEAKQLVLSRYNFWDQVIALVDGQAAQSVTPVDPAHPLRLWARKALRRRNACAALEDAWGHVRLALGWS